LGLPNRLPGWNVLIQKREKSFVICMEQKLVTQNGKSILTAGGTEKKTPVEFQSTIRQDKTTQKKSIGVSNGPNSPDGNQPIQFQKDKKKGGAGSPYPTMTTFEWW